MTAYIFPFKPKGGRLKVKILLTDVFEQIGDQKESPSVRNSFLSAVYELRNGFPSGVTAQSVSPATVCAMSTELLLDFMGIRVSSLQTLRLYQEPGPQELQAHLRRTLLNSLNQQIPRVGKAKPGLIDRLLE